MEGTNSCLSVVFTVKSRDASWKVLRGKKERERMKKEKGEVVHRECHAWTARNGAN